MNDCDATNLWAYSNIVMEQWCKHKCFAQEFASGAISANRKNSDSPTTSYEIRLLALRVSLQFETTHHDFLWERDAV
jgi:hypothetical protein